MIVVKGAYIMPATLRRINLAHNEERQRELRARRDDDVSV